MAKLEFTHEVSMRRGKNRTLTTQQMVITVDYNPDDDSIDDLQVLIFQNGLYQCEISTLLDKAQGDPLTTMIEKIDWRAIYRGTKQSLTINQY